MSTPESQNLPEPVVSKAPFSVLKRRFFNSRLGRMIGIVAVMGGSSIAVLAEHQSVQADGPQPTRNNAEWVFENQGFGNQLEITPEWASRYPQNVQSRKSFTDQEGNTRIFAVVNNTVWGSWQNFDDSILYTADCPVSASSCTPFTPRLKITGMENVQDILPFSFARILLTGEKSIATGITADRDCDVDKNLCQAIDLPPSGVGISLKRVDDDNIIQSNADFERGVGKHHLRKDAVSGTFTAQAVIDTQQNAPLRASSAAETIYYDKAANSLYELSLGSERLRSGIDGTKIDVNNNTATRNPYFQNYGFLEGISVYQEGSSQNVVVSGVDNTLVAEVSINPDTHMPDQENYQINVVGILNDKGIPNLVKDSVQPGAVLAKADGQGGVNNWIFGIFSDTDGRHHLFAGHYTKRVDPATQKSIVSPLDYWIELSPSNISAMGVMQRQLEIQTIRGQSNLVFPVRSGRSDSNFSAIGFLPINADLSPKTGARVGYIGNGLEQALPQPKKFKIFLPALFKSSGV